MPPPAANIISPCPSGGALLRVKAVPGAKRDEIVGPHGDRLKVRVSQPPEGGRANGAIVALISRAVGVAERDVEVVVGAASPMKTLRIAGVTCENAMARLLPSG